MNHDGLYMMENNYQYTLDLLDWCQDERIPFLYASSAAVYGKGEIFREERELEKPLNVYGYSKFLFDQVLRRRMKEGPPPKSSASATSTFTDNTNNTKAAWHPSPSTISTNTANTVTSTCSAATTATATANKPATSSASKTSPKSTSTSSTIPNFPASTTSAYCSQQFNELAAAAVNACRAAEGKSELSLKELVEEELIRYIPFPDALKGKYQGFAQADIAKLREAGYKEEFFDVKAGVNRYVKWMLENLA